MSSRTRARHAARSRVPFILVIVALASVVAVSVAWRLDLLDLIDTGGGRAAAPSPNAPAPTPTRTDPIPSPTPTPTPTPGPINTTFEGITTFRGNATRSWYGEGPV
ncbi:MAG: hypothetical protein ACRDGW_03890, partial [Actinomycetota bacterium]